MNNVRDVDRRAEVRRREHRRFVRVASPLPMDDLAQRVAHPGADPDDPRRARTSGPAQREAGLSGPHQEVPRRRSRRHEAALAFEALAVTERHDDVAELMVEEVSFEQRQHLELVGREPTPILARGSPYVLQRLERSAEVGLDLRHQQVPVGQVPGRE